MMSVVISAKAGIIAFPTASGYEVENIRTSSTIVASEKILSRMLVLCDDITTGSYVSKDAARAEAKIQWMGDRALALLLIALEPDTPLNEISLLASDIEPLLKSSLRVSEIMQRRLYARTLPYAIAYDAIRTMASDCTLFISFVDDLLNQQPFIAQAVHAFDAIGEDKFEDGKAEFRGKAIARGMFRAVVLAASAKQSPSAAKFELYKSMADQGNYREIVNAWTDIFEKTQPVERDWAKLKEAPSPPAYDDYDRAGGRAAYEQAKAQQRAILERLREGDEARARQYAAEMVASQKRTSQPEHIAKSLTNISTQARELQAYALSLEWAHQAVQVKADDARAWAHVAEALVHFGKFSEALEAIENGEPFGEGFFFTTLRARILRIQHRLPEAYEAYHIAIEKSAGSAEEPFNIAGAAEVLRDMEQFDEALEMYGRAKDRFPYNVAIRNGFAATMADAGYLERSLNEYSEIINFSPDVVSFNGYATVLRNIGKTQEAIEIFEDVVEQYPFDVISRCGLAECYFDSGDTTAALRIARDAYSRFPENADAAQLMGTLLARSGETSEAAETLEMALKRFPYRPELITSMASVERRLGRYDEALRLYDLGRQKFPNSKVMVIGRASMLRRLGNLTEALAIYDSILDVNRHTQGAINAKASILIYMREYAQALDLIRNDNPKTADEWRAFLLRCHLDWKAGFAKKAMERLDWAISNCPFSKVRAIFSTTRAAVLMSLGRLQDVSADALDADVGYTEIVRLHVYVAQGNIEGANAIYKAVNDNLPPQYVRIVNEVAIAAGLKSGVRSMTDDALLIAEGDMLLLEAA